MSCKECTDLQLGETTSFYRWGNANVEVRACEPHLKEVYDALNHAQHAEERVAMEEAPAGGGNDLKYGNLRIAGIPPDEPVFVLRAQDAHAIYVIEEYQRLAGSHDKNMHDGLDLTLARFRSWPTRKLPD